MRNNIFTSLQEKLNCCYVLGVSGGPDSMFLLEKMRTLKYNFVVCHVNYRKRDTSYFDEKIVYDYCNRFGIKFFLLYSDSYEKGNFQSNARNIRYNFFSKIANEINTESFPVKGIIIAHNFEDLLETYVLQKRRCSLVNNWGLQFKTPYKKTFIIRPILNFRKEKIINFLNIKKINYAIDESNFFLIYKRNIVRKDIFSLSDFEKEKINEEIKDKNKNLSFVLKDFKKKSNFLINYNKIELSDAWIESCLEVQKRLIFMWVNNFSNGIFFQKKKNIIFEIVKQLKSKKENILISIGNGIKIEKLKKVAFLKN